MSGKVYAPYGQTEDGRPVYALATVKDSNVFDDGRLTDPGKDVQVDRVRRENRTVIELIKSAFYVVRNVPFGHDPRPELMTEARRHPVIHAPAADVGTGVQVVSRVVGPLTRAIRESGRCPCPKSQCPDPDTVNVLLVPYTQGAHIFRVEEGAMPQDLAKDELPESFAEVTFPEPHCWVWPVTEG